MKDDINKIISKLIDFKTDIMVMDNKVRLYVSDRKKYSHPNHEPLIEKIRKFESQVHSVRNTEVQLRLDSLMLSLLINEKHWKRLFDGSLKKNHEESGSNSDNPANNPLVDRIYELSKQKWEEFNVTDIESKTELAHRILPVYKNACDSLRKNEKIKFYYDKKRHCVDLKKIQI